MRALRARAGALVVIGCTTLAGAPSAGAAVKPIRTLAALQRGLHAQLRLAGGSSSALVVDETTGRTLFAQAPNTPRLPASVEKLYTTSTALQLFGATTTLQTTVLGSGTLTPGGVWRGTLYLRGGGDPTFGDASFDHAAYGTGATVQALAAEVRAAGITRIAGAIVGDESTFDPLRGTPATRYAANIELEGELSGLSFDAGFTSASESALQPRPALFAAQAFAAALRADGVKVPLTTRVYSGVSPTYAATIASVDSPPMATLLALTNAPSDNFFAETLLKDLGARFGSRGSTAAGAAVVRATMAQTFSLHPLLNDGSGLSRSDHTTAAQVVSLLDQQADNEPFVASLAVAGVSGTMQGEMLGTPAVGNCRGKTGTLADVANLAGYCTAGNGDRLIFAFLENRLNNSDFGHETEDAMGAALSEYDPGPGGDAGTSTGTGSGSGSGSGTGTGTSGDGGSGATAP